MAGKIVGIAIISAAAACGGGPAVEGTNAGIDYSMGNAYFVSDGAGGAFVLNTDDTDLCHHVAAMSPLFNTQLASYAFGVAQPGTYRIADGTAQARAQVVYVGACAHHPASTAIAGTLTLTEVDGTGAAPTHLVGSVDLGFPDGGVLHGPFDATACPGDPRSFIPYYPACY